MAGWWPKDLLALTRALRYARDATVSSQAFVKKNRATIHEH
jgi:hypothetical protein